MFVVRNATHGNVAYSNLSEGIGRVLRFGANGPDVIARLRLIETVLAPTLRAAVRDAGGIDLKSIQAQALLMGDEVHSRNAAATLQFLAAIAVPLADAGCRAERDARVARVHRRQLAVLPEPVDGVVEGDHGCRARHRRMQRRHRDRPQRRHDRDSRERPWQQWFEAPSDMPVGLFFPGFAQADANADLGDSAICETAGFGGFSLAASPALVQLVGGTVTEAIALFARDVRDHGRAQSGAVAAEPRLRRRAVRHRHPQGRRQRHPARRSPPGIAHKSPGVGQIGAGIVRTPMACFTQAVLALAHEAVMLKAAHRRARHGDRAASSRRAGRRWRCCATAATRSRR